MENENSYSLTNNLISLQRTDPVISLTECKEILNSVRGKRKFKDNEIQSIRDLLLRMAEIEYLQAQLENLTINTTNKK